MFEIFKFSFNAVMPILLLAFLGYVLRLLHFADDAFFKKANTMVFKVFLSTLLFYNVYEINDLSVVNWAVTIYCVVAILILALIGWIVACLFVKDKSKMGAVIQCTYRSNYAIIGIPLAETLGGANGVAFASILSAIAIPLFNILAVMILSYYSDADKKPSIKKTLIKTIKNPLIIGVFIGILVILIRNALPLNSDNEVVFSIERDLPFLFSAISSVAKVASPLALIVLGARFDFSAVSSLIKEISLATFMRLIFAPAFGLGIAYLLTKYTSIINVTNIEYPALISLFSTPVAISSSVMIGEIGGDEQLGGQLVVWTSVISMFSMFGIIFFMKTVNLI